MKRKNTNRLLLLSDASAGNEATALPPPHGQHLGSLQVDVTQPQFVTRQQVKTTDDNDEEEENDVSSGN